MPQPPDKSKKSGPIDPVTLAAFAAVTATDGKNLAAQLLGQRGGLRRAETMTPERRSEIARAAAKRRWEKASRA